MLQNACATAQNSSYLMHSYCKQILWIRILLSLLTVCLSTFTYASKLLASSAFVLQMNPVDFNFIMFILFGKTSNFYLVQQQNNEQSLQNKDTVWKSHQCKAI